MNAIIILTATKIAEMNNSSGYLAGLIIALLILTYLIYSLVKPEKF